MSASPSSPGPPQRDWQRGQLRAHILPALDEPPRSPLSCQQLQSGGFLRSASSGALNFQETKKRASSPSASLSVGTLGTSVSSLGLGKSQSESRLGPPLTKAGWKTLRNPRRRPREKMVDGPSAAQTWLSVAAGGEPGADFTACLRYDIRQWREQVEGRRAFLVAFDAELLRSKARSLRTDVRSLSGRWLARDCLCAAPVPLAKWVDEAFVDLEQLHVSGGLLALLRVAVVANPSDFTDWCVIGEPFLLRLAGARYVQVQRQLESSLRLGDASAAAPASRPFTCPTPGTLQLDRAGDFDACQPPEPEVEAPSEVLAHSSSSLDDVLHTPATPEVVGRESEPAKTAPSPRQSMTESTFQTSVREVLSHAAGLETVCLHAEDDQIRSLLVLVQEEGRKRGLRFREARLAQHAEELAEAKQLAHRELTQAHAQEQASCEERLEQERLKAVQGQLSVVLRQRSTCLRKDIADLQERLALAEDARSSGILSEESLQKALDKALEDLKATLAKDTEVAVDELERRAALDHEAAFQDARRRAAEELEEGLAEARRQVGEARRQARDLVAEPESQATQREATRPGARERTNTEVSDLVADPDSAATKDDFSALRRQPSGREPTRVFEVGDLGPEADEAEERSRSPGCANADVQDELRAANEDGFQRAEEDKLEEARSCGQAEEDRLDEDKPKESGHVLEALDSKFEQSENGL